MHRLHYKEKWDFLYSIVLMGSKPSNRKARIIVGLCLLMIAFYGVGRLYFWVTDGFTIGNISSDFAYDPRWDIRPLTTGEQVVLDHALSQHYRYLGKGCQSYVFKSADGKYILKFFKYQRYRVQPWIDALSFIPSVNAYRHDKLAKKRKKLDGFFESWKIAFEELKPETGLVFVHLNKTNSLHKQVVIIDKMGFQHTIDMDQMEFLIQRSADMLCPAIDRFMREKKEEEAKRLLSRIVALVVSEYSRGLADNDHALMQNSGVLDGFPVHIDVGQFTHDDNLRDPGVYKRELFSKTYKFRIWLQKRYPTLEEHLKSELIGVLGDDFYTLKPKLKSIH